MTESWIGLPLTKVRAIQPDGSVLLHTEDYIPPVTGYAASSLLSEWLTHLNGLVKMRAEMLANRLSNSDGKASASAEIVDYLLLQIFNKYEPILDHLRHIPELPPITLYQELAKFSGNYLPLSGPKPADPARHLAMIMRSSMRLFVRWLTKFMNY